MRAIPPLDSTESKLYFLATVLASGASIWTFLRLGGAL